MLQNLQTAAAQCHPQDSSADSFHHFDRHVPHGIQELNQRSPDLDGDAEPVDDFSPVHAAVHDCQLSLLRWLPGVDHQLRIHLLAGQGILRGGSGSQLRCCHRSHDHQAHAKEITNS